MTRSILESNEFKASNRYAFSLTVATLALVAALIFTVSVSATDFMMPTAQKSTSVVINMAHYSQPAPVKAIKTDARKLLADNSNFKIHEPHTEQKIERKPKMKKQTPPTVKKMEQPKPLSQPIVTPPTKAIEETPPLQAVTEHKIDNATIDDKTLFGAVAENIVTEGHPDGTVVNADITAQAAAKILYIVERNKKYPKHARRTGAQGTAKMLFCIGADGTIKSVSLERGSGHAVLDNAAEMIGKKLEGVHIIENTKLIAGFNVIVPVEYTLK